MVTRGIGLNDLVGRRFAVGEVGAWAGGCATRAAISSSVTQPGVLKGLANRGGLRADIVRGGGIAVGDEVRELGPAPD